MQRLSLLKHLSCVRHAARCFGTAAAAQPASRSWSGHERVPPAPSSTSPVGFAHHAYSTRLPAALSLLSDCVVDYASGSYVYGLNGRQYLDFTSGIGVTNLGHAHPAVTEAVSKQAKLGSHLQVNCVTSQPMIQLAEKIGEILPPGFPQDYQVLFSNSGAESIENAVKLARTATGRQTIIVFQGGFHGRTLASGALSTAKHFYRTGFQPSMSGVHVVPFPNCYQCAVSRGSDRKYNLSHCCQDPMSELRLLLKQQTGPSEVAAILVEPIQGEGGYIVPPPYFLAAVRDLATEIGALMIADEVQSGYGRTGRMFAIEHWSVIPDIIVAAKGIANGYPLSCIITDQGIMNAAKSGSIGGTYGGNAVSCAAGVAVIDTFQQEDILNNVNERGEQLRAGLTSLAQHYPIGDVRGLGLMNAIQFHDDVPVGTASTLSANCVKEDFLILTAGVYESLRLIPPLTVSAQEVDEALEKLERGLKRTFKQ